MTTDWTFEGTWPHAPQWFDTEDGKLHFIDVGPRDGRPVVLVHGNPSWGYLYRHFIGPLVAKGHRVIVPDHLGFGRSDKPAASSAYAIERHAKRLEALLESLQLTQATLVVHDWGSPLGLWWATRHAGRIAALALLNGFVHRPTQPVPMPLPLKLFRLGGLGELFVKGLQLVLRGFLFGGGTRDHARLTATVRRAYAEPNPTWASRSGVLAFARQFPSGPEGDVAALLGTIEAALPALAEKPTLILWGLHDVVFGPEVLARWQTSFPHAKVVELPNAGHFLQEDAHEDAVPALLGFLGR